MTEDAGREEWKAPYIAYSTLTNFIDQKCGSNPLPPRIDRSFLDNYSGSVQPLLLGALRTIGLIGEDNRVLLTLRDAARSPATRKGVLRAWAEEFYKEQTVLAEQHATSSMLQASFASHQYSGSTLRKAIVFYLSLVDDVGLPKSPHFKAPKQPAVSTRPRPKKAAPASDQADAAGTADDAKAEDGDTMTLRLRSGGTITVTVDVNPLKLKGTERRFFYKLVDHLYSYEKLAASPSPNAGVDQPTPEEPST
jgi:hypothetical protein